MREIRFRAWNKVKKIMITDVINNCINSFETVLKHSQIYEVTQYIGLKDNEYVEIYDEDIIEFFEVNRFVRGEVEWLQEDCRFVVRVADEYGQHYTELYGDENFDCTVIGNMYENKDLLED